MKVEVGKRLQFPEVHTTLCPDIVLWDRKIILVELTVPWGKGCDKVHEKKALKYQPLVQEFKDKGRQTRSISSLSAIVG